MCTQPKVTHTLRTHAALMLPHIHYKSLYTHLIKSMPAIMPLKVIGCMVHATVLHIYVTAFFPTAHCLVEKHLIEPQHAARSQKGRV